MVRFGWFLVQPEINFLVRGGLVFHGLLAAFGVFLIYFLKLFFTKIYFWFHNLQIYTPTARLQGGRPPAVLLPGGRDLNINKIYF